QGADRLVILGDLFQAWVGIPRFETPEVAAAVAALRDLRRRGVRVDYIEGNRDFFLRGGPYADAFDTLALEVAFEAGGPRYLAVHGDRLNDRDWQDRDSRRLCEGPGLAVPRRAAGVEAPAGRVVRPRRAARPRPPPRRLDRGAPLAD